MKTKKSSSQKRSNSKVSVQASIVEVILQDHRYLKECIDLLTDLDGNKRSRLSTARGFLDALSRHSASEDKVLYDTLVHHREFRSEILEGKIEHGIADHKVKMLKPKLSRAKSLTEDLSAELKVLAEFVEHHIQEEEKELLPKVKKEVDSESLQKMGASFIKIRQFKPETTEGVPEEWMRGGHAPKSTTKNPLKMLFPVI